MKHGSLDYANNFNSSAPGKYQRFPETAFERSMISSLWGDSPAPTMLSNMKLCLTVALAYEMKNNPHSECRFP